MADEHKELLARARQQFEQDVADEQAMRSAALASLKFIAGDQWDSTVLASRNKAGRPALTFNRCHTFVQQVSNEARQNKPQIKYVPAEEGDKDTAEVYEGLARHIQYDSEAQVAYETALEYSAGGGFGFYRFLTDYCNKNGDPKDPATWDQDLKVVPVLDPFAVYGVLIPACMGIEPDHAFVASEMPAETFKREYPKSDAASDFDAAIKGSGGWVGTETVRIAEYWYVEETLETVQHPTEKRSRQVSKKTVKYCKINGYEVLEGSETTWVGYCIPIVPVLGKQLIVDGKPLLFSVISFQMDAQKLINAYKTRIAEILMTSPIQPFMMAKGQDEGFEHEYIRMNTWNLSTLHYNAKGPNGELMPPPQRQVLEAPIGSLSEAVAQEIDDTKATAGIYDASLGSKGNETSGIALQRRQQQSNITNLHYMDNLERSFKKGGMIMAEVLPKVYDTPRIIRILGADEAPKMVRINAEYQDAGGKPKMHKIGGEGVSKYDVVVTMGKAFSTKRMESFDFILQLVQAHPEAMGIIGDLLLANSDIAGADQMAKRYKKMLPPGLQNDENQDSPEALQAKLAATEAQNQQLTQALHETSQEIETKKADHDARIEVARINQETQLAVAEVKANAAAAQATLDAELQNVHALLTDIRSHVMGEHSAENDAARQSDLQAQQAAQQPVAAQTPA